MERPFDLSLFLGSATVEKMTKNHNNWGGGVT
jgi:hypothetical protein